MLNDTVLVTGGSGYIGSHVVRALAASGSRVAVFDMMPPPNGSPGATGYFPGDITKPAEIERAFRSCVPSCVIHLAAITRVRDNNSGNMIATNVEGGKNVVRAMGISGCRRMVFASSAAVYGNTDAPAKETDGLHPVSAYGTSKVLFEQWLKTQAEVSVTTLRLFNVAGNSKGVEDGSMHRDTLLMNAIRSAFTGSPLVVYGSGFETRDGSAIRDYVYVEDAAGAIVAAANRHTTENMTVNIAGGGGTTNKELVRMVESVSGLPIRYAEGPQREGEIPVSVADIVLAKRVLSWTPKRRTEDIVASAIEYVKNHI